MSSDKQSDVQW